MTMDAAMLAELREFQAADRALGARGCVTCGCTDRVACPEGCYWVDETTCSQCVPEDTPGLFFRTATGTTVRSFGVDAHRNGARVQRELARAAATRAAREARKASAAKKPRMPASAARKARAPRTPNASVSAAAEPPSLRDRLLDLLEREGGVLKRKGLDARLGCSVGALQGALKELVDAGDVRRERALLPPYATLVFLPHRASHQQEKALVIAGIRLALSTGPRPPSEA